MSCGGRCGGGDPARAGPSQARSPARRSPAGAAPPCPASPARQVGMAAPNMRAPPQVLAYNRGPQLPRFPSPANRRAQGDRPVCVVAPTQRRPPIDQTFRIPNRMPPVPVAAQRGSPANRTYTVPADRTFNVPANRTFNVPADRTYNVPADRTYSVPADRTYNVPADRTFNVPCNRTYNVPADRTYTAPADRTYTAPADRTYNVPADRTYNVPADRTYTVPADRTYNVPADRTYTVPKDRTFSKPASRTFAAPDQNATYSRGAPEKNKTYVKAPKRRDETFNVPPRAHFGDTYIVAPNPAGDLADTTMDEFGGDNWNVSTAVSIEEFAEENAEEEEDEEVPAAESTRFDDEGCPPCEEEDSGNDFGDVNLQSQLDNLTQDVLYHSSRDLDAVAPPDFPDVSDDEACHGPCAEEDESLGILGESEMEDSGVHDMTAEDINKLAEGESNISVFDAEVLNRTTAPRSDDLAVPRTRIWQTLMNSLNEMNNVEELEFDDFLHGLQEGRRELLEESLQ